MPRPIPVLVALATLAALPAQTVTEIAAPTVATTTIDTGALTPGPITVAQLNAAGQPSAASMLAINSLPSTAAAGVYDTNATQNMVAFVGGQLQIIAPQSSFDASDYQIVLAGPSTEIGFSVGDWVGGASIDFLLGGTLQASFTSSSYTANTAKYFQMTGGVFDTVEIHPSSTGGNFVIGDFEIQLLNGLFAGFSATPTTGSSPLTVQFTDTSYSSDPLGILAWSWDFGDGTTSTLQSPSHTYANCGNYTVSLTVIDASNPPATETKPDLIMVDPITADFTATPQSGFTPLIVNFTDASTGSPTGWSWDFDNDGTVDATVQNPTWAYALPGSYTVSLTVTNGCSTATETKVNFVTAAQQGARPLQPEILQLQFNEFRGNEVANTATTGAIAQHLTVSTSTWQGDAARNTFRGNDAGYGCFENIAGINTNWPLNVTGSFSIGFWIRKDQGVTTTNPFGYVFSNGTFRAFAAGASGTGMLFRGSSLNDFNSNNNIVNVAPGQWVHMLLVVDDAAGMATWYSDGVATATLAFTANTFSYASTSTLKVGDSAGSGSSSIGQYWAIDDFRFYSRALQAIDAQALFLESEHATAGSFGTSCPTAAGNIGIAGTGGWPTAGNVAFGVQANNLEAGQIAALIFDVFPAATPVFNLDPWLGGPGCELQIGNLGTAIGIPGATGTISLALPIPPGLAPTHLYAQAVQFGSAGGGTSRILDVNIQD